MAITAYELLSSDTAYGLSIDVMEAIDDGKQPFGQPFESDGRLCQAVIEGAQVLVGETGDAGPEGAVDYSGLAAVLDALPTVDPADGTYWLDAGVLTKSTVAPGP